MSPALRAMVRRSAFAVLLLAGFASRAHAQWSADVTVEQFDWREHTTPIVVHEQGPRFAAAVGYLLPKERGVLFGYRGALYAGDVDYNGSFQFDATTAAKGASNYVGTTQSAEARWRWPGIADALVGVDLDFWSRRLSTTQEEKYRVASVRLGAERVASDTSRLCGGIGMRILVATHEDATIEVGRDTYALSLSPGLGTNPYLHAGVRVWPHVTVLGYWDGMSLGRSNQVVLLKRGKPQAVVSQPDTDVSRVGVRVAYGW